MGVTAAGVIISEQTYGGKIDAGQVAYLKSDGKWYLARANSVVTSAGDLAIALDSGVAGGKGRLVKLGYVNNTAWSWTPGAPLYLSAATAGGLTQTRPTGAGNVVREVATVASDPSTIYFDPSPSSGPLATVEGLTAEKGDLIIGQAGAWAKLPAGDPWAEIHPNPTVAGGLAWRPTVPDLLSRVVYETDAEGNTLEIHQVYIPPFYGAGLPDANLNGVLFGGFWIDKYLACQPDASNVSRGSVSPNAPGANGAASKPHVVPWTNIDWSTQTGHRKPGGLQPQERHLPVGRGKRVKVLRRGRYPPDRKRVYVTQARPICPPGRPDRRGYEGRSERGETPRTLPGTTGPDHGRRHL